MSYCSGIAVSIKHRVVVGPQVVEKDICIIIMHECKQIFEAMTRKYCVREEEWNRGTIEDMNL